MKKKQTLKNISVPSLNITSSDITLTAASPGSPGANSVASFATFNGSDTKVKKSRSFLNSRKLNKKINVLSKKIGILQSNSRVKNKKISKLNKHCSELAQNNDKLKQSLQDQQNAIQNLKQENAKLQISADSLEQTKKSNTTLQKELTTLKARLVDLTKMEQQLQQEKKDKDNVLDSNTKSDILVDIAHRTKDGALLSSIVNHVNHNANSDLMVAKNSFALAVDLVTMIPRADEVTLYAIVNHPKANSISHADLVKIVSNPNVSSRVLDALGDIMIKHLSAGAEVNEMLSYYRSYMGKFSNCKKLNTYLANKIIERSQIGKIVMVDSLEIGRAISEQRGLHFVLQQIRADDTISTSNLWQADSHGVNTVIAANPRLASRFFGV